MAKNERDLVAKSTAAKDASWFQEVLDGVVDACLAEGGYFLFGQYGRYLEAMIRVLANWDIHTREQKTYHAVAASGASSEKIVRLLDMARLPPLVANHFEPYEYFWEIRDSPSYSEPFDLPAELFVWSPQEVAALFRLKSDAAVAEWVSPAAEAVLNLQQDQGRRNGCAQGTEEGAPVGGSGTALVDGAKGKGDAVAEQRGPGSSHAEVGATVTEEVALCRATRLAYASDDESAKVEVFVYEGEIRRQPHFLLLPQSDEFELAAAGWESGDGKVTTHAGLTVRDLREAITFAHDLPFLACIQLFSKGDEVENADDHTPLADEQLLHAVSGCNSQLRFRVAVISPQAGAATTAAIWKAARVANAAESDPNAHAHLAELIALHSLAHLTGRKLFCSGVGLSTHGCERGPPGPPGTEHIEAADYDAFGSREPPVICQGQRVEWEDEDFATRQRSETGPFYFFPTTVAQADAGFAFLLADPDGQTAPSRRNRRNIDNQVAQWLLLAEVEGAESGSQNRT